MPRNFLTARVPGCDIAPYGIATCEWYANANVMIEESSWNDGDYWITLWFHQVNGQWLVLDSCRWQKDVRF
jgi:hypothetical protein